MASEQGIVVKVDIRGQNVALVQTVQPSGCEACSARKQCTPMAKGKERKVEAVNLVNAQEGDIIQISMDTQALLQATFLLYIFPIICMLVGSFIGHTVGNSVSSAPSIWSLCGGIACFVAAMIWVRYRAGHMALKQKYQPKITRIISRANSTTGETCHLQEAVGR